ncbi:MAG: valine--tRNA ligase [Alphaproteobacteria bacterium]|nr:valine--tRNA ligase [Alphaproteobacteria bacterium]
MLDKTFVPSSIEKEQYEIWEKSGAFSIHPNLGKQPYTIMMPPPNVTGNLHMGHALTFTLQDILIRYHRMCGYDVLWQPGTDHAGIATQMVVERQLEKDGLTRTSLGRPAFLEKVWAWKNHSGNIILNQLRRLGASPDWSRERFTMDAGLSKAVRKLFVQLYQDGLIYRDKRLVNWDPKLHTAISDLEVEQREIQGQLWYIKYFFEDNPTEYIVVATTRPETLFGDVAVAVHPDDSRYQHMIGKKVIIPLANRIISIIADTYSDPEKGSGAVKVTPAHDFNDFDIGKRHKLPTFNIFDQNACLNDQVPDMYQGLSREQARQQVLKDLETLGYLEKTASHSMTVPYGDRSGVVIEPWLTDQWYVDTSSLAKKAIEVVEKSEIKFVPDQWKTTYFQWMHNIQPWCISRQLWWGHQIPVWYSKDGKVFVAETEEEALVQAKKHYGHDVILDQDQDVLDTWFSSALWPFSTLGWPDNTAELQHYYPTDVLVTGFDIIFFWVARMIMMGLYTQKKIPFKTVYIHALIRDEFGQKMSKSKGNIIDPLDLMDRYGTDAVRFTLASLAVPGRDIKLAESRIEGYRNFVTKLWNAARFCQMNECEFSEDFDLKTIDEPIHFWIMAMLLETTQKVEVALSTYRFNDAAYALYHFIWHQFCDWYIEFIKLLLTDQDQNKAVKTRNFTSWLLMQILHLLHPFMPFVTEKLWKDFNPKGSMLMVSSWPNYKSFKMDETKVQEIQWVIKLIETIRALRSEMALLPSVKPKLGLRDISKETIAYLQQHQTTITRLARLDEIILTLPYPSEGCVQIVFEGNIFLLNLTGLIDLEKEKNRLYNDIKKIDQQINMLTNKLNNQKFLQHAQHDVIEEQKQRLKDNQDMKDKLEKALSLYKNLMV